MGFVELEKVTEFLHHLEALNANIARFNATQESIADSLKVIAESCKTAQKERKGGENG